MLLTKGLRQLLYLGPVTIEHQRDGGDKDSTTIVCLLGTMLVRSSLVATSGAEGDTRSLGELISFHDCTCSVNADSFTKYAWLQASKAGYTLGECLRHKDFP